MMADQRSSAAEHVDIYLGLRRECPDQAGLARADFAEHRDVALSAGCAAVAFVQLGLEACGLRLARLQLLMRFSTLPRSGTGTERGTRVRGCARRQTSQALATAKPASSATSPMRSSSGSPASSRQSSSALRVAPSSSQSSASAASPTASASRGQVTRIRSIHAAMVVDGFLEISRGRSARRAPGPVSRWPADDETCALCARAAALLA